MDIVYLKKKNGLSLVFQWFANVIWKENIEVSMA